MTEPKQPTEDEHKRDHRRRAAWCSGRPRVAAQCELIAAMEYEAAHGLAAKRGAREHLGTATGLLREVADREPCYETGCPDDGTPLENWCHSCRVRAFLAELDKGTTDEADEARRGDKSR